LLSNTLMGRLSHFLSVRNSPKTVLWIGLRLHMMCQNMEADATQKSMLCLMIRLPTLHHAVTGGPVCHSLCMITTLGGRWIIHLSLHIVVARQMLKATRLPTTSPSPANVEIYLWMLHRVPHLPVFVIFLILNLTASSFPLAHMCHKNGRSMGFVFLLKR
jgi:hypothetical protein